MTAMRDSPRSLASMIGILRSNHRVVYQVGPGLRYWLHPQFAFSATAALRGDFAFNSMTQPNQIPQSSSSGVTGIAGIMEFIGVF